jgi:predicted nucleotidyltransferase
MTRADNWQEQIIEELQALLKSRQEVIALALFGSALSSERELDPWSDVDCLLVVGEQAYSQFFPSADWLHPLGELFTHQHSENSFHGTLRACLVDFRRIDFAITTPSQVDRLSEWPGIPFWQGVRLIFSRSPKITELLFRAWPPPKPIYPSASQFEEMVDQFWFKAVLAGYKVVREDPLIALHLALDLVRDCCVVGMMLRDRLEGTNIHEEGGVGNKTVADLENTHADYTPDGILDIIEQSAVQFDRLAAEWSETYAQKRAPLIEWLGQIRRTLLTGS